MTAVPSQTDPAGPPSDRAKPVEKSLLFDISGVDLGAVHADIAEIERWIPHRDQMQLLHRVVWVSDDGTCSVGVHEVRGDAFWTKGHFPEKPMLPGVIMIEAGAQLACYSYNVRRKEPAIAAFLRIDDAVFRNSVEPGSDLILLCKDVKLGPRRFITEIQGLVDGQVAFSARVTGMNISGRVEQG